MPIAGTITPVARAGTEPVAGLWIGVIHTGKLVTGSTINVKEALPGINKVWYAQLQGTGKIRSVECFIGGTAKVTVGTCALTDSEMFVVATSHV